MSKDKSDEIYLRTLEDFLAGVQKLAEAYGVKTFGIFCAVSIPNGVATFSDLKGETHEILPAYTQFMAEDMTPKLAEISGHVVAGFVALEKIKKALGL